MQHRRRPHIAILIVGSTLMLFLPAAAWCDAIPRLTVQTLEGVSFTLPNDLEAAVDILVVGFTQKAGSNTRPWTERLRAGFHQGGWICRLPRGGPCRGARAFSRIRAQLDSRGRSPEERGRFLIVDQDESDWRALAGYRLPDDPYIIVLDRTGNVLDRETGLFDEKSYQDVAAKIRAALK